MSMKKKIMAAGLAVCLVATLATGITLAYFTDDDSRTNTFTAAGAGGVDALGITLTEDASGRTLEDGTVLKAATSGSNEAGFTYENVLPGLAYDKNVDITLDENSLDVHLYVELVISNVDQFNAAIANVPGINTNALQDSFLVGANDAITQNNIVATKTDADGYHMVFDFGVMSQKDETKSVSVFEGVKIPAAMTGDDLSNLTDSVNLSVKAYAIQYLGLEDGLAANAAAQKEWFSADKGYDFVTSKLPA